MNDGKKSPTSEIVCYTCGGTGHMSKDCASNKVPPKFKPSGKKKGKPKKGISWKKPANDSSSEESEEDAAPNQGLYGYHCLPMQGIEFGG